MNSYKGRVYVQTIILTFTDNGCLSIEGWHQSLLRRVRFPIKFC